MNVSRETRADLEEFADQLLHWSRSINLVSCHDHSQVWTRHIEDSLQITQFVAQCASWLDFGSGGGFPALPLAIWAKHHQPGVTFTLVESDARKSTFLRQMIRLFDLQASVMTSRIEHIEALQYDVISARALADLPTLLAYADPHVHADSTAIFPKGRRFQEEIDEARRHWRFDVDAVQSLTDKEARILVIKNLERRK